MKKRKRIHFRYLNIFIFVLIGTFLFFCGKEDAANYEEGLKRMSYLVCRKTVQCFLKTAHNLKEKLPEKMKKQTNVALPPHRRNVEACANKVFFQFLLKTKKTALKNKKSELINQCGSDYNKLNCQEIVIMGRKPASCQKLLEDIPESIDFDRFR